MASDDETLAEINSILLQKRNLQKKQEAHHKVGAGQNARPLNSKTLQIFFTQEIWRPLWHCITFKENKAVGCGIYDRFSNFNKCRPEAACDFISDMALGYVGTEEALVILA